MPPSSASAPRSRTRFADPVSAGGLGRDLGAASTPTAHPTITVIAPISSTALGRSPSNAHAAVMPTIGTNNDSGATLLAGWRDIRYTHSPDPTTVPSSTV